MSLRRSGRPAVAGTVALVLALILTLTGCGLVDDADESSGAGCGGRASERQALAGFGETTIRLTAADGEVTDACALLAEDDAARTRGLMGQSDLRGYDAMVFRFPSPSLTRFHMRDTLIPLTVAFFAADGTFVSAVDMTPCPPGTEVCPSYEPAADYLDAVEVPVGDLGRLGGGPGSVLSFPAPVPD